MNLVGDNLRGYTDLLLLSILHERDSYGYQVNQLLLKKTNDQFSLTEATLYTRLKRLEKQDAIVSYWLETENQKKRKYYSLTDTGKQLLEEKKQDWINANKIIKKIV